MIFLNFQNYASCEKYLKDTKHNSLRSAMLGYLSLVTVICSLLETDNVHGQVYPRIVSGQMEAIVYIENNTPINARRYGFLFECST